MWPRVRPEPPNFGRSRSPPWLKPAHDWAERDRHHRYQSRLKFGRTALEKGRIRAALGRWPREFGRERTQLESCFRGRPVEQIRRTRLPASSTKFGSLSHHVHMVSTHCRVRSTNCCALERGYSSWGRLRPGMARCRPKVDWFRESAGPVRRNVWARSTKVCAISTKFLRGSGACEASRSCGARRVSRRADILGACWIRSKGSGSAQGARGRRSIKEADP